MSISVLRAAFASALEDVDGLPPIRWENTKHDANTKAGYVRPWLMPADVEAEGCGTTARDTHTGFMQLTVGYPVHTGTKELLRCVDVLRSSFKRGTLLDVGEGQDLEITSAEFEGLFIDDNRAEAIVSLYYLAHLNP